MSKGILIAVSLGSLLLVDPAFAETNEVESRYQAKPDYGRAGWYVGVAGGAGWDFFDKAFDRATMGAVGIGAGGSFNARGGYRVNSWFALEGMYEGIYGMNLTFLGLKVADLSLHTLTPNFKFILPIWRLQPYLAIGPGAQYGQFDGVAPPFSLLDTKRWDFVLRLGFGLDTYITENWIVNFEIAPSVRFRNYTNIPSELTDNVSLTFSGGVQYRF